MSDFLPESDEVTDVSTGKSSEWKYDLFVDCLLAFGVAVNVYFIVDVATDGQLSRDVATTIRRNRDRIRVRWGVLVHKQTVLDQAHQALYDDEESQ